jgi:hypothetical protein
MQCLHSAQFGTTSPSASGPPATRPQRCKCNALGRTQHFHLQLSFQLGASFHLSHRAEVMHVSQLACLPLHTGFDLSFKPSSTTTSFPSSLRGAYRSWPREPTTRIDFYLLVLRPRPRRPSSADENHDESPPLRTTPTLPLPPQDTSNSSVQQQIISIHSRPRLGLRAAADVTRPDWAYGLTCEPSRLPMEWNARR